MSTLSSSLISGLTKSAIYLVEMMKQKVSDNNLPSMISDAMSIEPAQATDNGGKIDITISIEKAPMAAAFEWGSGLYDPRGAYLIPIPQVKPGPLHFWWENRQKWFFGARLPYGHPGVAPRPYIKPTIDENLPKIKEIIGQEVKASIMYNLVEKFKT